MKQMKSFIAVLLVSSCTQVGSFCSSYVPVDLSDEAAWSVINLDRLAAENIAVNEDTYRKCP